METEHTDSPIARVENPFGDAPKAQLPATVAANTAAAAELAEIRGALILARENPRDERQVVDAVLTDCTRVTLAEKAEYAYKRGSEIVAGPSIRLAETIARRMGNMRTGWRVMSQGKDGSEIEAFCWELETNRKASRFFYVPHERHTRQGVKRLTDPRDIYELQANMAARRLRACILEIVPPDIVEAAQRQCQMTLTHKDGAPEERVAKMVERFAEIGVTREQLNKRLGHPVEKSRDAEVLNLVRIFNSIRDGIGKVSDFFEADDPDEAPDKVALADAIRARNSAMSEGATA